MNGILSFCYGVKCAKEDEKLKDLIGARRVHLFEINFVITFHRFCSENVFNLLFPSPLHTDFIPLNPWQCKFSQKSEKRKIKCNIDVIENYSNKVCFDSFSTGKRDNLNFRISNSIELHC